MGQKQIMEHASKHFFKDYSNTNNFALNAGELQSRVKLTIQLTNANGTSYSYKAFDLSKQANNLLVQSDDNPARAGVVKFNTVVLMEYFFEREQPLMIEVLKNKSIKSTFKVTLGSIVGSRKNTLSKKLADNMDETIVIQASELKNNKQYVQLAFEVPSQGLDYKNPKNLIYFEIHKETKLYQSETISHQGTFQVLNVPIELIEGQFQIYFYNSKGRVTYTLTKTAEELSGMYDQTFVVPLSHRRNMTLKHKSKIKNNYTFIDYLQSGVQIGLGIAIDFTGSNGHPRDQGTLHYISPGVPNGYERAIMSCGNIIAYYDYDQMFPVYGFGAVVPGEAQASMCFNLNMQQDPHICTINEVINAYHNVVFELTFSGPTYFSAILEKTISMIRYENDNLKYNILLILTDGIINDMDKTIDLLVQGAKLPLSVIIVGIGKANFDNMMVLDADDEPLVSSTGEKSARDLVQFVPFSKFEGNAEALAREVLEEIPKQVLEFYDMIGISPNLNANNNNNNNVQQSQPSMRQGTTQNQFPSMEDLQ
jgi:hypothetical protein